MKLITAHFFWPNMRRVITDWARACLKCQRAKVQRHVRAPLGVFSPPEKRFRYVRIDIVGPWPVLVVHMYQLISIVCFSCWSEATPITDISAETIAKTFVSTRVSRFRCPERITTDRGRQFEASPFRELSRILGTQHIHTTSYYPASNGFHRQLKAALRCWTETLPIVLLGCRFAIKVLYGTNLALPGTMFTSVNNSCRDLSSYISRLRSYFMKLPPMTTRLQTVPTHVSRDTSFYPERCSP